MPLRHANCAVTAAQQWAIEGARSEEGLPTFWIPVDSGRKSTDGTFAPLAGRKSTELPYRSPSARASESIV